MRNVGPFHKRALAVAIVNREVERFANVVDGLQSVVFVAPGAEHARKLQMEPVGTKHGFSAEALHRSGVAGLQLPSLVFWTCDHAPPHRSPKAICARGER